MAAASDSIVSRRSNSEPASDGASGPQSISSLRLATRAMRQGGRRRLGLGGFLLWARVLSYVLIGLTSSHLGVGFMSQRESHSASADGPPRKRCTSLQRCVVGRSHLRLRTPPYDSVSAAAPQRPSRARGAATSRPRVPPGTRCTRFALQ